MEGKRKRRMPGPASPFAYIPIAYPLSSFERTDSNGDVVYVSGLDSDNGEQAQRTMDHLNGTDLLFTILTELNDREKIIFLYQILIDFGYDASQESYAKTLKVHRVTYTKQLQKVRKKIARVVTHYNRL